MAITIVSLGNTDPTESVGGKRTMLTSDSETQQTLLGIHTELRKMNLYNEIKTDEHIEESDLDKE